MSQDSINNLGEYLQQAGYGVQDWMFEVTMPRHPFQHQLEDLKFFAKHSRWGLFSQPGVGKTLPMQAFGTALVSWGYNVVFIMPPILLSQFLRSFRDNYQGIENHVSIEIFGGSPKKRDEMVERWDAQGYPNIILMSYRMFVKNKMLCYLNYQFLMIDEATVVKNATSQIYEVVKDFTLLDDRGLGLITGTPIETNVEDCFGLIKLITPDAYGSFTNFEYCHMIKESFGIKQKFQKTLGYKNLDVLHEKLYKQARRILKSDVSDLPPRLFSEYLIELTPKHQALYNQMVQERMVELPDDELIDLTLAQSLYQAMQRVLLTPEQFGHTIADNSLLECIDSILDSLSGRKVVMFAWFNASVEMLAQRYKDLNPRVINGQVTGNNRDLAKSDFINDDKCFLLIMNPKSGGVGVDLLQNVSSDMIFAEPCALPGVFEQALGRLHRTGQKSETVNVHLITAVRTVSVTLRNKLITRDEQQESVVRDKRMILKDLEGSAGLEGNFV